VNEMMLGPALYRSLRVLPLDVDAIGRELYGCEDDAEDWRAVVPYMSRQQHEEWLAEHADNESDSDDDEEEEQEKQEEDEEEEDEDEPNIHTGHTADEEALGALFSGLGGLANPEVACIAHYFRNGTPLDTPPDSDDDSD
jgi:hypothetical protein